MTTRGYEVDLEGSGGGLTGGWGERNMTLKYIYYVRRKKKHFSFVLRKSESIAVVATVAIFVCFFF